jgi:thioredoxin reductase (NADPH)
LGKSKIVHVAILGSGSAGSSAALYAARLNRHTVVFEGPVPGGALTKTTDVENWPGRVSILGNALVGDIKSHARSFGAQFVSDTVTKVDFSQYPYVLHTENGDTIHALSVIIATGAKPRTLGVPGEKEYWGRGVTTCAVCDAPFYKGEEVVVVGGGDSAVEEAIQLAQHAAKVTILVRGPVMRAIDRMQARLKQYPSISIKYNTSITSIMGNGQEVTRVEVWNSAHKKAEHIDAKGVFLAIGHLPESGIFKSILSRDKAGYLLVKGRTQETVSAPGVFAAGDVEDSHYRQAAVAAGSGIKAALEADAFLTNVGLSPALALQLQKDLFKPLKSGDALIHRVESLAQLKKIRKEGELLIVDFYAHDCPNCIEMAPVFESIAQEFEERATFASVDADRAIDIVKKFFVEKVPCILVFNGDSLAARYSQGTSKKELRQFIERLF